MNALHAFCLPNFETWQWPGNVHFKPMGSEALAEQVATVIDEELVALGKK